MNVNKKFDRFKQWGRERMGSEVKTDNSDDFKVLEVEMTLRQEGMERLQQSSTSYIKSLSRRDQGEGKEKHLPVGHFANVLLAHGDDFEPESEFGQCLSQLGRANERIARMQETYVANATSTWIESTERSLAQMKEYQKSKQKLESRRLALDTAQVKLQKSKREDFRAEEELRSQKAKYEESNEDVYRRMFDIKEAEADSIADLTGFLEAELAYYDRCREVLLQIKRDWPAPTQPSRSGADSPSNMNPLARRGTRSRSNTAGSLTERFSRIMEEPPLEPPAKISSRLPSGQNSPRRELPGFELGSRPIPSRTPSGFEGPTSLGNGTSTPPDMRPLSRVPTDSSQISNMRLNLRATTSKDSGYGANVFEDADSEFNDHGNGNGHRYEQTRSPSWSMGANQPDWATGKKAPPPPPPSRSKKPPPPPPMKRSALSTSEVPHY